MPLTDAATGALLVSPLQAELARHSGVRFFAQHKEAGDVVLELLQEEVTSSEVTRIIGPHVGRPLEGQRDASGKVIDTGLRKLVERFGAFHGIKLGGRIAGRAAMVANEALAQIQDVIPNATHKELGALSMAATQATQIQREQAGVSLPPVRHVHLHVTAADLERMHEEAASKPIIDA
jgi:hypothetical protein